MRRNDPARRRPESLQRGLRPGHIVQFQFDAHVAWQTLRNLIAKARHTIDIQLYMLQPDAIGEAFVAAIEGACQRGVQVRMVLDGLGSSDLTSELVQRLRHAGVQWRVFGPIHLSVPWRRWMRRNHRKVFVFDGRVAVVTGRNIGSDYLAEQAGAPTWADLGATLHGPAVRHLARQLQADWDGPYLRPGKRRRLLRQIGLVGQSPLIQGEATVPLAELPFAIAEVSTSHTGARVAVALNLGRASQARANLAYLQAIRAARRTVLLAHAYFLPDRALVRALIAAVRRGVQVRVLLPDPALIDVKAVAWASLHGLGVLLRAGVEVRFFDHAMLHAKAGVVDGVWWTLGSANLDPLSRRPNLEANLVGYGRAEAAALGAQLEGWFERAIPFTFAHHAARSCWQRVVGRILWRVRAAL